VKKRFYLISVPILFLFISGQVSFGQSPQSAKADRKKVLQQVKIVVLERQVLDSIPQKSFMGNSSVKPRRGVFVAYLVELENNSRHQLQVGSPENAFSVKTKSGFTFSPVPHDSFWDLADPLWAAEIVYPYKKDRGWIIFDLESADSPKKLIFEVVRKTREDENVNITGIRIDLLDYGIVETLIPEFPEPPPAELLPAPEERADGILMQ